MPARRQHPSPDARAPDPDPELPRVSSAEWEVAEVVWRAGRPVSSTEIVERLSAHSARHPKTVRTLLHRLVQKRVVVAERRGRMSFFFPRLSRTEYLELETQGLLERVFAGRRIALLLHFLDQANDLSDADLAVLGERIDVLRRGRQA